MASSEDLRPYGNPGSDAFRLEAYPFYLLNRVANRYNLAIEAELRKIGIDIPTWRVLMILGERQPLAIGQIAKSAVINLSTTMRIIERMSDAGLVTTAPSAQDGRVTEVSLTAKGEDTLAEARQVTAPLYEKIIRGFSARDFARTLELLNRLYDNLV
ncbi:MarR family transcriptional regulator [Novosphingobium sp. PC22D]|uniref:MarR family winged helix-turn-helix transcriptional regulator n=1 Tax=Novosphingobium sp. PC22D TaxID=1962403 RepID=UPI000BF0D4CC|nr:MarR family transcriptional regulator [Novosphingobium sp. PC22D]PEQ13072.1 MarR family transcriptional regulator [Novosphingobium sp. PC22D]